MNKTLDKKLNKQTIKLLLADFVTRSTTVALEIRCLKLRSFVVKKNHNFRKLCAKRI